MRASFLFYKCVPVLEPAGSALLHADIYQLGLDLCPEFIYGHILLAFTVNHLYRDILLSLAIGSGRDPLLLAVTRSRSCI